MDYKIVKFKGGLGNQLFQYAFLRKLELEYGCNVKGDFSYFNKIKNDNIRVPRILKLRTKINIVPEKELEKILIFKNYKSNSKTLKYKLYIALESMFNSKYYFEKDRKYRNVNDILQYIYYDGYWQSWKYLINIENQIRKEIVLKNEITKKNQEFINKIKDEESVFIGVRRGDYLQSKRAMKHFGAFKEDYFNKAIGIIKKRLKNPKFYIFSNDIDWVKNNITFTEKVFYRGKEGRTSDLEELFVLSSFKHAIIVNSTFYWWGAWLINNNKKIIIAPKKWFADNSSIDIIPPQWIKINNRGEVI